MGGNIQNRTYRLPDTNRLLAADVFYFSFVFISILLIITISQS